MWQRLSFCILYLLGCVCVRGSFTDLVYAAETPALSALADSGLAGRSVWITLLWEVNIARSPERFELLSLLPRSIPGRQQIDAIFASRKPDRTYTRDDNFYARWLLNDPDNGPHHIIVAVQATLFPAEVSGNTALRLPPGENIPRQVRSGERMIEVNTDEIRQAAEKIPAGGNDLETARNIMTYVGECLSYRGFVARDGGALNTLKSGTGDCTDYVDLFVALCRAKDIPARHISGVLTQWLTVPGHSWAEFYTPEQGWVRTDPLHTDLGKAIFGRMEAKYLQLSSIRNDERLNEGMLYRWSINGSGGAVVNFLCSERAESPLPTYPDIRWEKVQ